MIASVINVIRGHRLSKAWGKLQTEEMNRKHHNFAGFGSIKHHLGKNKSFVQCSIFLCRCKYMIYALINKCGFTQS